MISLACPVCDLILTVEAPACTALVAKPARRLWPEKPVGSMPAATRSGEPFGSDVAMPVDGFSDHRSGERVAPVVEISELCTGLGVFSTNSSTGVSGKHTSSVVVQNHMIEMPLGQRDIRSNAAKKNCNEVIVRQKRCSHAALVPVARRSRSISLSLPSR
jgi:hypothetical protein